jgi:hypothetical protein
MPRTLEVTKQLHKFIYEHWVFAHRNQNEICRMVNETPELRQKFGELDSSVVSYHVNQIRLELEQSLDHDAIEKYTAEYVRFQHSLESEIEDVENIVKLIDKEKEKETWIKLKRLKKELIETKLKALQDHELPLTIKKYKAQRNLKIKTLKVIPPLEDKGLEPETEVVEDWQKE